MADFTRKHLWVIWILVVGAGVCEGNLRHSTKKWKGASMILGWDDTMISPYVVMSILVLSIWRHCAPACASLVGVVFLQGPPSPLDLFCSFLSVTTYPLLQAVKLLFPGCIRVNLKSVLDHITEESRLLWLNM